jgi:Zn-finger nucleic acid-binding protein
MHCENCGGSVLGGTANNNLRCDFCEASRCEKVLRKVAARIKLLRGSTDVECPGCSQELRLGKLSKSKVLHCTHCRGLLMTTGTLREMVRQQRSKQPRVGPAPQAVAGTAFRRSVACPQCTMLLELHPYHGPGQVMIESCGRCNLVWFDPRGADTDHLSTSVELPVTMEMPLPAGGRDES